MSISIYRCARHNNTTYRTTEDECKWFFSAIWFILLRQIGTVKHGSCYGYWNIWLGAHNIHEIHTLCTNMAWCCEEPVSRAFWHLVTSNLIHSLMPTARSFLRLAGRVPHLPQHPRWPHFRQGPLTPPSHRPLHMYRKMGTERFFFIRLPFAHRATRSYQFANGLNGLNWLAHLCNAGIQKAANWTRVSSELGRGLAANPRRGRTSSLHSVTCPANCHPPPLG